MIDNKKRLFVNCSGLPKSHILERTRFVLSFFDSQSDKNTFFKIVKVPKSESVALDELEEIIRSF